MKNVILYNETTDKFIQFQAVERNERFTIDELREEMKLTWQFTGLEALSAINMEDCPLNGFLAAKFGTDTFAVMENKEKELMAMNYAEWETLRLQQASKTTIAKEENNHAKVQNVLQRFTENMAIKYQGKKSWQAIYEDLAKDLNDLVTV